MNEDENGEMRGDDLGADMQKGAQVAGEAAGKVGSAAKNKAQNAIHNKIDKIKSAKTMGEKPGEKVGVGKKLKNKAKGKAIEAKGNAKKAAGTALTGVGLGSRAAGLGTRVSAQIIRGAGSLLGMIPYVGPAIKSALESAAKTTDQAGKKMNEFGKKVAKKGRKQIKSGMHDIKRGRTLANTGKDIGAKNAGGMGSLPQQPGGAPKTNILGIVNREKRKAKLKKMFDPRSFSDPKMIVKRCIIFASIAVLILIFFIVLYEAASVEDSTYTEGDYSNVPFVVSEEVMNNMVIVSDESGGYKYAFSDSEGNIVDLDVALDNALATLRQNNSTALSDMGKNDTEKKELLTKLIMAEIATQYPDLNLTSEDSTSTEVTYSDDGSLQGKVAIQRKDGSSTQTLEYTDEDSFNQMIISGSSEVMNYYTLKKESTSSSSSYSGTDILNDWVASWENSALFLYKKGQGSYDSSWVKGYITSDGKYYICKTDEGTGNGTMNYGFGVCVYNPNESGGWMHVESFAKYGVDITKSVLNETQVEVDIVDQVKAEELQEKCEYITEKTSAAGITLSDNELNALAGIAYQFGNSGANLDLFISLYKQYGNTEELKEQYHSSGGTYVFKHVLGGTNPEGIDRAAANWALFHDGIYYAGSGGTLNKNNYGSSTGNSVSSSQDVQSGDFTGTTNADIAWNFLKSMGLSDISTAAIIGNLMLESGGNTKNISPTADNGSHRGIAQWDYSDRYARLKKYAASINGNPDDIEVQLQFLWLELCPTADHTYASARFSQDTYNTFISYNSLSEATKYFAQKFEGCTDALSSRQSNAEKIYEELAGTTSSGSAAAQISTLDNFLFIGDSRYDGSSYITALGNNIKNAGKGSATISDWITVLDNGGTGTVQGQSRDITGTYSGISVQLGANGVYQNVANTEQQMKELIEKLKAFYPNTPIFINGCLQVSQKSSSAGYTWDAETFRDNVEEFNSDIANYCSQVSDVYYIDISDNLYDSNGYIKDEYTDDGLHCNNAGAKIFAENIKNAILDTATGSSSQSDSATSNGNTYSLVVANKNTVTSTTVDSYTYDHTTVTETTNGGMHSGSKWSETPASETISSSQSITYSSTTVDYQTPLKPYTLYFDFLWAILINSQNRSFVISWADLAINSEVYITVYSEETSTVSTDTQSKGITSRTNYNEDTKIATTDIYDITETTTTTTNTINSKVAITNADTWLLKYENNADSYAEYQAKSKEQITEKIDSDSDDDNIITLLQKSKDRLNQLYKEKYIVDESLQDNEKVSFMIDTYEYILNIAKGKNTNANKEKLLNSLDTSAFDLSSTTTVTKSVLKYTSLTITDEDKELLYKFVEKVGNGSSDEEKEYLASVILNRALTGKFGGTSVSSVIKKSNQFENFDASSLDNVTASDATKALVDGVISNGDTSDFSVYYATSATAEKKGWDTSSDKQDTVTGNQYKFYTSEKYETELKKYVVTVSVSTGSSVASGASSIAEQMVAWAEQWVGQSTFESKLKGTSNAKNYCARFVMSAYDEVGLGYYGASIARELPHPNAMKYNSDGTVDWSEIPVGAIIVSNGTGSAGHVCLYIGNGYVIEAGADVVKKSAIDDSLGGSGHNCSPFLGWGFATQDQDYARQQLVTSSANYETGWTDMSSTVGTWGSSSGTGIEGVFNSGDKTFKVFAQGCGPWALQSLDENGGNFKNSGCGVTSVSIILTGLGYDITPSVFAGTHSAGDTYVQQHLSEYNVQYKQLNVSDMSDIVAELKKGNPVILHINNGYAGGKYYEGHFVTLLAVNEKGEIFLGDPGSSGSNTGWYTQDKFTGRTSAFSVWK